MSPARTFVGYQLERSTQRRALHLLPDSEENVVDGRAATRAGGTAPKPVYSAAATRIQAQGRGNAGRFVSAERRARRLHLEETMLEQRRAQALRDKSCVDAGLRTDSMVVEARASCEGAFMAVLDEGHQLEEFDVEVESPSPGELSEAASRVLAFVDELDAGPEPADAPTGPRPAQLPDVAAAELPAPASAEAATGARVDAPAPATLEAAETLADAAPLVPPLTVEQARATLTDAAATPLTAEATPAAPVPTDAAAVVPAVGAETDAAAVAPAPAEAPAEAAPVAEVPAAAPASAEALEAGAPAGADAPTEAAAEPPAPAEVLALAVEAPADDPPSEAAPADASAVAPAPAVVPTEAEAATGAGAVAPGHDDSTQTAANLDDSTQTEGAGTSDAAPAALAPDESSSTSLSELLAQTHAAVENIGAYISTGDEESLPDLLRSAELTALLACLEGGDSDGVSAAAIYEASYRPPEGASPLGAPYTPQHYRYDTSSLASALPELMREIDDVMAPFGGVRGGSGRRAASHPSSSGAEDGSWGASSADAEYERLLRAAGGELTPAEEWLLSNRERLAAVRRAAADIGGASYGAADLGGASYSYGAADSLESSGITSHATQEEVFAEMRRLGEGVAESVGKVARRLNPQPQPQQPQQQPGVRYSALGPFPPQAPPPPPRPPAPPPALAAAASFAAMPLPAPPPLPVNQQHAAHYYSPPYLGGAPVYAPADEVARPFPFGAAQAEYSYPHLYVEPQLPALRPLPPLGGVPAPAAAHAYPPSAYAPADYTDYARAPASYAMPSYYAAPGYAPSAAAMAPPPPAADQYRSALDDFRSRIAPQQPPVWQPSTSGAQALQAAVEQSRWRAALPPRTQQPGWYQGYGGGAPSAPAALSSYDQRVRDLAIGFMSTPPAY